MDKDETKNYTLKDVDIIETKKKKILSDLKNSEYLKGVNKCNFDFDEETKNFLKKYGNKLSSLSKNKGNIPFFEDYNLEKYVNEYVEKEFDLKYNLDVKGIHFLHDNLNRKTEIKEYILQNAKHWKWVKTQGLTTVVYETTVKKIGNIKFEIKKIGKQVNLKVYKLNYYERRKKIVSELNEEQGKLFKNIIENTKPEIAKNTSLFISTKKSSEELKNTKRNKNKKIKRKIVNKNFSNIENSHIEKIVKMTNRDKKEIEDVVIQTQKSCLYRCEENKCTEKAYPSICSVLDYDCKIHDYFINKIRSESKDLDNKEKERKIQSQKENIDNAEWRKKIEEKIRKRKEIPIIGMLDMVVIVQDIFKCEKKEHHIEDIEAVVYLVDDNDKVIDIVISAGYCRECHKYFILKNKYENLKKRGVVLFETDIASNMSNRFTELREESKLMQHGYNVSQSEGLSSSRRQRILALLVDSDIMTKIEICDYLDYFIRMRSGQCNMEIAIEKWKADRKFVEHYNEGKYRKIFIDGNRLFGRE